LVTEQFGITSLHAVVGWSMGGQQTYEWAVRHPDMVHRAAIFAATAKTPVQNQFFIDVHTETAALGPPPSRLVFYADSDDVHLGLSRHAMAFTMMSTTHRFFRDEVWASDRVRARSTSSPLGFHARPLPADGPEQPALPGGGSGARRT
jgi:homoserine O-acetyltransferase